MVGDKLAFKNRYGYKWFISDNFNSVAKFSKTRPADQYCFVVNIIIPGYPNIDDWPASFDYKLIF